MIWLAGVCVFILLVILLSGRRGNTSPHCPVHKRRMSLCADSLNYNEFECPVPECAWHAYVFPDGHARVYEA